MKHIVKSTEPNSLKNYRNTTPNASYSGIDKKEVQKSLLAEQGHICAYCMRRISLKRDKTLRKPKIEIEHYRSQHLHPNLVLSYGNMLGVCNGNADKADHQLTCDKSKSAYDKSHDLTIDPLNVLRIQQVKYAQNGEVFTGIDPIDYDINEVLNLNEPNLKGDRANLYSVLKKRIRSFWAKTKGDKSKVKSLLKGELSFWESRNKNGAFEELCALPIYVLEKELKKF